jgi:flagellar basal-body rod modification protein FlgD
MNIPGISAAEAASSAAATATGSNKLDKASFVTLLVQQMKNQDPLAPTDDQAFIAQLAQFSSLEQMQDLNDNIVGLAVLQQTNALLSQLTQSSALIGQQVVYLDPETSEPTSGVVESVRIEDGLAVLDVGGVDVPLGNVVEITGPAAEDEPAAGEDGGDTDGQQG